MKKNKIILASASPRRRELLSQIGIAFSVVTSGCEEKISKTSPDEIVMELSQQKAEAVYGKLKKEIEEMGEDSYFILAADTIVSKGNQIFGKPEGREDAYRMIQALEGSSHQVYTGVCILLCDKTGQKKMQVFAEKTEVFVNKMTEEEINCYLETGEAYDKAGAYGIQGCFARYIRGIEGDYFNVVGLPVSAVYQKLTEMGYYDTRVKRSYVSCLHEKV